MMFRLINYDRNRMMDAVAKRYYVVIQDQFDSQGEAYPGESEGGGAWKPLNLAYVAKYRYNKNASQILRNKGQMQKQIKVTAAADHILAHATSPYARDHQEGAPKRWQLLTEWTKKVYKSGRQVNVRGEDVWIKMRTPKRVFMPRTAKVLSELREALRYALTGRR